MRDTHGLVGRAAIAMLACLLLLAAVGAGSANAKKRSSKPIAIDVLSNRADLVSGGDALVAVRLPKGARASAVRIKLNGRNVKGAFKVRAKGRLVGLLTGLREGRNTLTATRRNGSGARIKITNHPNGGPVFSGPQVQPWLCQETATDKQCNQPPRYEYQYKSSSTGQLRPYDPENPPSDVANTTTDRGETVPFIIRIETGYQDRDQYKIAVLYDPAKPWAAWAPQKQWNHKLLITHGASCGIDHKAGTAPSVTGDQAGTGSPTEALARGFAVMSTALNNAGHNCNIITQAESLVMAKERLVEQYGELRYTIGTGCSGGSLTQQQVANAYPGVYQGILPQCSFPDAWSTGQQLVDYHLVRLYVENPGKWGPGVLWTPAEIAAVEGHPNHVNSIVLDSLYWTSLGDPTNPCAGVSAEERYHPENNPRGVRCTLADYMVNVFGPRSPAVWTEVERKIGQGFAGIPLDTVGVQYGLEALTKGEITAEQFVDLNARIGGGDIDTNPRPERLVADQPALRNAYRSGAVNSANNLDRVAILDLRGPDHGAFHDAYRSWAMRARLEREQGRVPPNHVIWMGHTPLIGDPRYTTEGLIAMDRWLAGVERDRSKASLPAKIAKHRPEDVRDRCSNVPGVEQVAVPGIGQACKLQHVEARYGTPRTVAGESIATDSNKCTLKPLRRTDYYPVEFTDDQWARLEATFPTGVCDYGRPGVDQGDTIPWMTYKTRVGGEPLGDAPRSKRIKPKRRR
jgi:hypothetical protein